MPWLPSPPRKRAREGAEAGAFLLARLLCGMRSEGSHLTHDGVDQNRRGLCAGLRLAFQDVTGDVTGNAVMAGSGLGTDVDARGGAKKYWVGMSFVGRCGV